MNSYDRKVEALINMGVEIDYVPTAMTRSTDWRVNGKRGLYHYLGKYFKVLTVMERRDGSPTFMQPVLLQEDSQYSEQACFKTIGRVELPVRFNDEAQEHEIGIWPWQKVGAFGQVIFTAPRYSFSSEDAESIGGDLLFQKDVRADAARMTGFGRAQIRLNAEPEPSKTVWFLLSELPELMQHERMCDSYTCFLCQTLLLNAQQWLIDNRS